MSEPKHSDKYSTALQEATRALEWIVRQYSDSKPTFEVAQDAYAMFSEARMALTNIKALENGALSEKAPCKTCGGRGFVPGTDYDERNYSVSGEPCQTCNAAALPDSGTRTNAAGQETPSVRQEQPQVLNRVPRAESTPAPAAPAEGPTPSILITHLRQSFKETHEVLFKVAADRIEQLERELAGMRKRWLDTVAAAQLDLSDAAARSATRTLTERIKALQGTRNPHTYSDRDWDLIDTGAAGMRTMVLELLAEESPLSTSGLTYVDGFEDGLTAAAKVCDERAAKQDDAARCETASVLAYQIRRKWKSAEEARTARATSETREIEVLREIIRQIDKTWPLHGIAPGFREAIDKAITGTPLSATTRRTNAPFQNCRYEECDLPGQCVGEGKCHHPADTTAPKA